MQKQTNEAIAVNRQKTMKLAKMGMLVAISILLVNIHFPIFGPVAFLEYDPADIPILIGGFAFGPLAGVCITIVTAILQGFQTYAPGNCLKESFEIPAKFMINLFHYEKCYYQR